ncbi:hypothetical protein JHK87_046404 [Glycine soja]|nr:hypothetical protein JHK87_046404 [Glycine soja]
MDKAEKAMRKSYFDVLGLCCSSEVPLIENILRPLQGIKEVSVIVPSRTVIVVHDTLVISQLQIVEKRPFDCAKIKHTQDKRLAFADDLAYFRIPS